ncbi:MAG: carbohydrate kinase [Paracoccus sp. (in: a-proteobacteria)]|nr:carbohydrate kinase [Paracoccus sp. (in: a-proteobacteria)]
MILCCGESLIDMVPDQGAYRPLPGGSVFNTAIALGRLGANVRYLWPLSEDRFGAALRQMLDDSHVDWALCPATPRPTALAFVHLGEAGEAEYSFHDEGSAGRNFEPAALPNLPKDTEALFIGGISLVREPCGGAVEELALRAAQAGVPIMLDPNIRPGFIESETETRARLGRLMRLAQIVKLSQADRDWLFPDLGGDELAEEILGRGAKLVVLTSGAEGAAAYTSTLRRERGSEAAELADTIGAGDSFNAGLLAALSAQGALSGAGLGALDEAALDDAMALAARASAVTVSRPGANPPWRHELPE